MERMTPEKETIFEKLILFLLLAIGIVMFLLLSSKLLGIDTTKMVKQANHTELISANEIATLSVSEFVYNGIAQSRRENGEPEYNVLYKSTVKVSADVNKISYTIDEEQKIVTFVFPELTIDKPVIDVGSISIIPNKDNLFMDEVINLCRNDVQTEAIKSEKLISSAQENIQTIIEAWYSPVLPDYSFRYQFANAEGGEAK